MTPSGQPDLRVVLDTQVLLRGAVAKTDSLTGKIYEAWRDERFILLASEAILAEVDVVLHRPEVLQKLRFTLVEAHAIVQLLRRRAHIVAPRVSVRLSRDPDDDKFLECALAGKATYVVTADEDLLILQKIEKIPIINIPAFWNILTT